jgi:hypothetical protein
MIKKLEIWMIKKAFRKESATYSVKKINFRREKEGIE